jgi:hypothetical protein
LLVFELGGAQEACKVIVENIGRLELVPAPTPNVVAKRRSMISSSKASWAARAAGVVGVS